MRCTTLNAALAAQVIFFTANAAAGWKPADNSLTTPWTAKVRPAMPLPEYPRPQMVRQSWMNLNGLWDYAIQGERDGQPRAFEGQILVPFGVESALSGVKRTLKPDQSLWYRRAFKSPELKGGRLLLHFGAVDWHAEIFVNGKAMGTHEGGYDPFTFDITDALSPAAHQELTVAVRDASDDRVQPRGKQTLNPAGIMYTAVSGIWQTVWLERVPAVHITGLQMTPDIDKQLLRVTVEAARDAELTLEATLGGRRVGRAAGKANHEIMLRLHTLRCWSPDTPVLYDLHVRLKSGDAVKSYFGMRKIEVRKAADGFNRLFLNNQALFQYGPLDQGWWPDGLYTAPTDEALRFDIQKTKELGMNMCRKHVKVEPARWYFWCDRLGLLVWQDMPSAGGKGKNVGGGNANDAEFTDAERAIYQRELEAMIRTHRNAPSIVVWVPFNEGWGQHDTNYVLNLVKAQDPSRVVDGPSGWTDRGFGDMKDMHKYPGPDMFPAMKDRASVLGEFGGLGWPVEAHLWPSKRKWGYRMITDRAELQKGYENLLAKLHSLIANGLAAAVYTQTTDVEGEVNGFMTYDRKVIKLDAPKAAAAARSLYGRR